MRLRVRPLQRRPPHTVCEHARCIPMNDTKPGIAEGNKIGKLDDVLQRLTDAGQYQQLSDAIRAYIAAISYKDQILATSSRASLLAALADVANDVITEALDASEGMRAGL